MREIKFHAWSPQSLSMVDDFMVESNGLVQRWNDLDSDWGDNGDDLIVTQYTGLKDKNGVEIYEGDVVRRRGGGLLGNPAEWLFTGKVTFTQAGYKAEYQRSFPGSAGARLETCYGNISNQSELEVIGNIYEHPELLG